jgi:hypothetical protein
MSMPASAQFDMRRAEANYQLVLTGQASLASLSPAELAELAELDRAARSAAVRPRLSPLDRCRLLNWPKESFPSRLELEVVDLKCSQR